ncbi:hypothetical protein CVT25_006594 [Psilocybe cyanescens]|uniref:Peptidase A1 domain-containing protein n=1 Tax=Psilocybe cyanescens TaxID=93625 RepID=A0A409XKP6_PSICY|nr:hypothetical protein CVT25_006594 [Psilocybe cyanescens]
MATTFTYAKWKGKACPLDPEVSSSLYFKRLQRKTQRGRKRKSQQETTTERQRSDGDRVTVEGDGAADRVVLPLNMVGSGVYDVWVLSFVFLYCWSWRERRGEERKKGRREAMVVMTKSSDRGLRRSSQQLEASSSFPSFLDVPSAQAYTLPVKFGSKNQQFSLQIDTGSSDLWVALTLFLTSNCKLTERQLYDLSGSRATGVDFSIPYLQGSVAGPVVWDHVSIGGCGEQRPIRTAHPQIQWHPQARAPAELHHHSVHTACDAQSPRWRRMGVEPLLHHTRFLSLTLVCPGSDRVLSLLGTGRHPAALVPDPSKIAYSTLFWKVGVRAIMLYVGGERKAVIVGRSASGVVFPSAVVDSGVPLILTTSAILNAVYECIPCTTLLNLTLTPDTCPEIPIHLLDLTAEPPDNNQAVFCTGLIQTADAQLGSANGGIGDMILGIPFLQNVYSVMAYTQPVKDGSFAPVTSRDGTNGDVKPRLGLLALIDPTIALQEFNTVRVLHQPLSSSPSSSSESSASGAGTNVPNTGSNNNTKTVSTTTHKLSTGAILGVVLLGLVVLCAVVAGVRADAGRKGKRSSRRWAWAALVLARVRMRARCEREGGLSLDQKVAYAAVCGGELGVLFVAMPVPGMGGVGEDRVLLREWESKRTLLGAGGGKVEKEQGGKDEGDEEQREGGGGILHHHYHSQDGDQEQVRDFNDTDQDQDQEIVRARARESPPSSPSSPDAPSFPLPLALQHQYQHTASYSVGSIGVPLLASRAWSRTHARENEEKEGEGEGEGEGENSRKRGLNYSMPRRVGVPQGGGGVDLDSSLLSS